MTPWGDPEDLLFDEATHTYAHTSGRIVPGVTTVLSILHNFDAIPGYVLERARQRGVFVHQMIDSFHRETLDEAALGEHWAWAVPYLDAWKAFLHATKMKIVRSEQRIFNRPAWYAGTCDAVGEMDGALWVLDIKTGVVPPTVGAQLAAYQAALNPRPRYRMCVRVQDGDYSVHEQKDLTDFTLFNSCLNLWNFKCKHKLPS